MDGVCPDCGTQMVFAGSTFTPSTRPGGLDKNRGTIGIQQACPNPDCPGNESDLAKAVDPDGSSQ